jgi:hypothetical protein
VPVIEGLDHFVKAGSVDQAGCHVTFPPIPPDRSRYYAALTSM